MTITSRLPALRQRLWWAAIQAGDGLVHLIWPHHASRPRAAQWICDEYEETIWHSFKREQP